MIERFLPIGTVVLLKGATKPIMITSYCVFPKNFQLDEAGKKIPPEKKIYEYAGCTYPEGIIDNDLTCAFNHNQIDKVLFKGFTTEEYKKLNEVLNTGYEQYKKEVETKKTDQ